MNDFARQFEHWMKSNHYGTLEGRTGSGHLRYRLANGRAYIASSTPSKPSGLRNAKSQVRRCLREGSHR